MRHIQTPNLPQDKVRLAVIDWRADARIQYELEKLGIELIRTCRHTGLYDAVSYHPDMMIHHIGGSRIVFAPDTGRELLIALEKYGFELVEGRTSLLNTYPYDIAYNVARVGKFALHNLRYTDPVLLKELEDSGVELINVKQGYSKCSICVVDENSIITSDKGIAKSAEREGIEVLLIQQDENILLPGLDRGFIGGSTGLVDKKTLAVTGNAENLKSYRRVREYLSGKGMALVSLGSSLIVDMGSIIPLMVY